MTYFTYMHRPWPCGPRLAFAGAFYPNRCESRAHRPYGGHASFGVRRPLRYLTYHLDLDASQSRKVAAILNRLKTEREQAALDERRTVATLADLMTGDAPATEQLDAALRPRLDSADRLRREIARAVRELYDALDADQRERLADLMRSGTITV